MEMFQFENSVVDNCDDRDDDSYYSVAIILKIFFYEIIVKYCK